MGRWGAGFLQHHGHRSCTQRRRTSEGKGPGYLELRKMAATFMRDHRDDFLPFAELDDVEVRNVQL